MTLSINNETTINCPRCGTRTRWKNNPSRPFCSEKCRLVDLGCWANEDYQIVGTAAEVDQDREEQEY